MKATSIRLAITATLYLCSASGVWAAETPAPQPVLFLVYTDTEFSDGSGPARPATIVDPIALWGDGKYVSPPLEADAPEPSARERRVSGFEKQYVATGMQYPLFAGGDKAGSVTIRKTVNVSCESQTALAELPAGFALRQEQFGLATSWTTVRPHPNRQREPSADEKEQALTAARARLRKEGTAESDLVKMKIEKLVATDLDGDRKAEIIGSFSLRDAKREHKLLLIVAAGNPEPLLTIYSSTQDLEDMKDLSGAEFLDQLDLDGDGVDEIVVRNSYYESWDYTIYGRRQGTWKKLYKGAGGGC